MPARHTSPRTWWNLPRDANDLLYGKLDLLVLKAIAAEPLHDFGIAAVAVIAWYLPARRALRIDPVEALRAD